MHVKQMLFQRASVHSLELTRRAWTSVQRATVCAVYVLPQRDVRQEGARAVRACCSTTPSGTMPVSIVVGIICAETADSSSVVAGTSGASSAGDSARRRVCSVDVVVEVSDAAVGITAVRAVMHWQTVM